VDIDGEAIAEASEIYQSHALRPLAFSEAFTTFLMETAANYRELEQASPEYVAYAEACIDLHRLTEEIRFEGALAVLLLVDYRIKRDRGEAPRIEETMTIPLEAGALLRGYFRDPPPPSQFFREPHAKMSGSRVLSRWLAAQLLDSALYRAVAATDRLAVLLQARAGVAFPGRRGASRATPRSRRTNSESSTATTGIDPNGASFENSQSTRSSRSFEARAISSRTEVAYQPNSTETVSSPTSPRAPTSRGLKPPTTSASSSQSSTPCSGPRSN
jgi:hypothetical protein